MTPTGAVRRHNGRSKGSLSHALLSLLPLQQMRHLLLAVGLALQHVRRAHPGRRQGLPNVRNPVPAQHGPWENRQARGFERLLRGPLRSPRRRRRVIEPSAKEFEGCGRGRGGGFPHLGRTQDRACAKNGSPPLQGGLPQAHCARVATGALGSRPRRSRRSPCSGKRSTWAR